MQALATTTVSAEPMITEETRLDAMAAASSAGVPSRRCSWNRLTMKIA